MTTVYLHKDIEYRTNTNDEALAKMTVQSVQQIEHETLPTSVLLVSVK